MLGSHILQSPNQVNMLGMTGNSMVSPQQLMFGDGTLFPLIKSPSELPHISNGGDLTNSQNNRGVAFMNNTLA